MTLIIDLETTIDSYVVKTFADLMRPRFRKEEFIVRQPLRKHSC